MGVVTIALDAMGGDFGVSVVVPAALNALDKHPHLRIILVGDETAIKSQLTHRQSDRIRIHHTTEVVGMDELPSRALRLKKNSSMRVAINLVKDKVADACVSAGNTGALMATSRFVLKTIPGVDRPAIVSLVPTFTGRTRLLDLGANVDSCAEHLFQFAVMGSVLTSALDNVARPKVALLNIGTEEIKGNDQVKLTAQMLSDCKEINYVGFIEGDGIYKGIVDVIVCDGFVGNVALKASEGIGLLFLQYIKQAFSESLYARLIRFFAFPVLLAIKRGLDPSTYNGATFLGLNGIVIKSHGGANIAGFGRAINQALSEVENNVIAVISERVGTLLASGED